MLVVMQGHRLGIDVGFQGGWSVGERRKGEGPSFAQSRQALLSYGGFTRSDRGRQEAGGDGGAQEDLEE